MSANVVDSLNAALESRYRIERTLGEGGMASVYLADDLRHERKVALKVLKPELAAVVGAQRFLAEIKTTANLQHPHILPLFDSGEADGFLFYVMPYVEGESLRVRLDRENQLPVDEAVRIACDVAEALHAAHEQGVIHRDIKPANILLSRGRPLVADFGIALALTTLGGSRLTETGLSLGTPHYMSPEQAAGDTNIGPATDTYALGCVLYEMLVGEPPLTGSTPQAILGKIVTGRPDAASEHRSAVPPNVDAAVSTALEKIPADRFTTAAEFARALKTRGFRGTGSDSPMRDSQAVVWRAVAAVSLLLLVGIGGWSLFGPDPLPTIEAWPYVLPTDQRLTGYSLGAVALSRDGVQLAYQANGRLHIKRADELEGRPIPGVERGSAPFFSPDGLQLAYSSGGRLWRVPSAGGSPEPLAEVGPWFYGGDWHEDGFIVFANADGLHRVSEAGGDQEVLFPTTDPDDVFGPRLLPGGECLLLTRATARGSNRWNDAQVVAYSLESGERHDVTRGSDARYVEGGYLTYAIGDVLHAVAFDLGTRTTSGVPAVVAQPVQRAYNPIYWGGTANYDVSATGTLAWVPSLPTTRRSIVRVDRSGVAQPLVDVGELSIARIRLSPDGRRLVFGSIDPNDLWVYDMSAGRLHGITNDASDRWPVWVGNDWVAFSSVRSGPDNIFAMRWDLADDPVQLTHRDFNQHLGVGTRDGRLVALHGHPPGQPQTRAILVFRQDDSDRVVLESELTPPIPGNVAAFSPDGAWVVYSFESELFVSRADGSGNRLLISSGAASWALWADTGEVFYRRGNEVVAVEVATEPTLRRGTETVLFEGPYTPGGGAGNFEVTADGQTFFMVLGDQTDQSPTSGGQINVVLNWAQSLGRTMQAR